MQDKYLYEYAVIRFLPKVEREEFINIGVILYCAKKKFLEVKFDEDLDRINAFKGNVSCPDITPFLRSWKWISAGKEEGGPIGTYDMAFRFRWLTANRSTLIQSSKVHPGKCLDPDRKLKDLFTFYVK